MVKLTAKALKTTIVITADQIAGFNVPNGSPPVPFVIEVGGRSVTGTFNAKSLRKAIAAAAATPEAKVIVQGTLTAGNVLMDAGISVPPPKASAPASEGEE